jgi:3-hydroxyisobutyrate dehydrogenase-like beta-hydroxyacid dehydrogenase
MNANEELVGFVGLGHLGGTMARRLADAGHALVVYDTDGEHVRALTDHGAQAAGSGREVAERAGVVFTCLPSEEAARAAVLGDDGEGIALGVKSGLDRDRLLDVLAANDTVGQAHKPKVENARNGEYPVNFALRLMYKDYGLILEHARTVGAVMPAAAAAHQMCVAEHGRDREEDFSAVVRLMLDLSGAGGESPS